MAAEPKSESMDVESGKASSGKQVEVNATGAPQSGRDLPALKRWAPVIALFVVGGVVAVFCVLLIPGIRGDPTTEATSPMANSSTDSSSLAQLENGAAADSGALVVDTTDNSTTSDEGTQIVATPAGPQDNVPDDADTPSTETIPATPSNTPIDPSFPAPTSTDTPLFIPVEVTPTSTPTSTPVGEEWGMETTYTEQCRKESSEYQYYCTADCMVNCALTGHTGGLLLEPTNDIDAPYCSARHRLDIYGDATCCCADNVSPSEWSNEVIPCLGNETDAGNACQAWCKLRSETLMPYTSIDCDPGGLFCLPFGITDPDGQIEIECSDTLRCDCDIMT